MASILAIFGIVLFFFTFIGIVLYVIFALSFYRITVNAGIENPWLACIPIVQFYILAKIIKTLQISGYEIPNLEFILPGATILVMLLRDVPVIGSLLAVANFILILFALNKLYRLYKPEQAVLYTVLSIFSLPIPFIFLTIKDLKRLE
ncbi:hypothetical protein K9O30_06875 [Clostridium bowmanii]|uniref:hypothetical protein n=1 Tax=Clostridium bowmanii TaxID=132925 RepID=UPI001C0DBBCD|nr:hypothetical protein [Clostridium bowmanii]MBU3191345.1 hypothetical protein [Clostridium bowmanii]MCA1073458.1 hypothetical protein [Clostridium bowmanii]